jgi:hybrid cluster-associated redox disulfide protein
MQEQRAITPDMSIGDVITRYPNTIDVFFRHGLNCVGCGLARFENIGQGALAHGIDIDRLMQDLNEVISQAQVAPVVDRSL